MVARAREGRRLAWTLATAFSRAHPRQDNDYRPVPTPFQLGDMEPVVSPPEAAETVLFRPSKKRKIYRQRALDDVPDPPPSPPGPPGLSETPEPIPASVPTETASRTDEELESTRVSISEILRLRKLRKHRVGGVEFRASTTNGRGDDTQDGALVLHENSRQDDLKVDLPQEVGVVRKFAKQTGMVGDVDKHM